MLQSFLLRSCNYEWCKVNVERQQPEQHRPHLYILKTMLLRCNSRWIVKYCLRKLLGKFPCFPFFSASSSFSLACRVLLAFCKLRSAEKVNFIFPRSLLKRNLYSLKKCCYRFCCWGCFWLNSWDFYCFFSDQDVTNQFSIIKRWIYLCAKFLKSISAPGIEAASILIQSLIGFN